jgi:catechol 2,3-dioxygenase-like lactoylglutathione lyase family enzyme
MDHFIEKALNLPPLDQIGFVVKDIEASIKLYDPLFGPFSMMEPDEMTYLYRGIEEPCKMRLAFGKTGNIEIELIELISGKSPHKEFLDAGREGIHHIRFIVDDLDKSVTAAKKLKFKPIWTRKFAEGLAVAYLERNNDPLLIEFFENHGTMPE